MIDKINEMYESRSSDKYFKAFLVDMSVFDTKKAEHNCR